MGLCCSCSCCSEEDEETRPIVGNNRSLARYPIPEHELKKKRVRVVKDGDIHGALVKDVFLVMAENPFEEAIIILDEGGAPVTVVVDALDPIPTIRLGDYCVVQTRREAKLQTMHSGFVRGQRVEEAPSRKSVFLLHLWETNYTQEIMTKEFDDCHLLRAPPPVSEEVSEACPPIGPHRLDSFLGRNRGIQGKRNSCYLDTLLFASFAFSDVVLSSIQKHLEGDESSFWILCNSIIFPLRRHHFVSMEHVELLRSQLSKLTDNECFEDETRDLPEAIEALFGKMLKWQPPLSISSTEGNDYRFDRTFTLQVMETGVEMPNSQNLLNTAACFQKFCIEKVPSFFILQIPREVHHQQVTFPDLEIDLGLTLFDSPKDCALCKQTADLQFFDRFESGGLEATFVCRGCAEEQGLRAEEARQLPEGRQQEGGTRMSLSAVICIEKSHYNCFARCGDHWVFFDSMSDQEELKDILTHRDILFNIPLVEKMPHFSNWLTQAPRRWLQEQRSLSNFLGEVAEEERSRVGRIFNYSYMLFYSKCGQDR